MGTGRLEAFSDGVIAIIVTIMVLQLATPAQPTPGALLKLSPILLSYALSFLVVAIMWVNHHHLIHAVRTVSAPLLWSNINLLFWMSLIPFVADYLGRFHRESFPVALYGLDLGMCGVAFTILRRELVKQHAHDPEMTEYHGRMQLKNLSASGLYLSAAALAYASIYFSYAIYIAIPAMYFLPGEEAGGEEVRSSDFEVSRFQSCRVSRCRLGQPNNACGHRIGMRKARFTSCRWSVADPFPAFPGPRSCPRASSSRARSPV
jgi:uncharacterized membrane protein